MSAYKDETYKTVCCWMENTRIKYVPNPKRGKSKIRYAAYEKTKTVGQSLACGSKPLDLLFDYQTGLLSVVGGPVRKEPLDPSKIDVATMTNTDKVLSIWFYRSHPEKLKALRDAEKIFKEKSLGNMNLKSKSKALDLSEKLGLELDEFSEGMLSELDAARRAADNEAKSLLETATAKKRCITDDDCLRILRKWAFRKNEARQNVMPEGSTFVHSDTLGLIRCRDGRYIATEPTVAYPHVMGIFNRWLKDHVSKDFQHQFPFTSISVNYAYAAKIHRDQGNHGPSMGAALGNFTGGRLQYWEDDNKSIELDDLLQQPNTVVDVAHGPKLFDGRRAHAVEPFKGERFSLVFFSYGKYWKARKDVQDCLNSCGVTFPTDDAIKYWTGCLSPPKGYSDSASPHKSSQKRTNSKSIETPPRGAPERGCPRKGQEGDGIATPSPDKIKQTHATSKSTATPPKDAPQRGRPRKVQECDGIAIPSPGKNNQKQATAKSTATPPKDAPQRGRPRKVQEGDGKATPGKRRADALEGTLLKKRKTCG